MFVLRIILKRLQQSKNKMLNKILKVAPSGKKENTLWINEAYNKDG